MKIICTQENLIKGINIVANCIKKSTNLSILSNILLEVKDGQIKASATNLEIGITTNIRGKIEKTGKTVVPAQLFLSYINNLPKTKITMELEGDVLTLSCDDFRAQIKCFDPNEYPLIPKVEGNVICKFKGDNLKEAIGQVIFSAAKDESRPEIAGVYFKIDEKKGDVYLVTTDSYRLSEKKVKAENLSGEQKEYIIPAMTFQEIGRIINSESEIEVFASEDQIKFNFDGTQVISKIIEGQYPDYKQIIPESNTTKIKLNKNEFVTALKSSSLFSKQDTSEVNIKIEPKKKEIEIVAESKQVGSGKTKIIAESVEGKEERVIFNYQYILEGLANIKDENIFLMLNGDSGPAVIKPINDDSYLYIVMPIKK